MSSAKESQTLSEPQRNLTSGERGERWSTNFHELYDGPQITQITRIKEPWALSRVYLGRGGDIYRKETPPPPRDVGKSDETAEDEEKGSPQIFAN